MSHKSKKPDKAKNPAFCKWGRIHLPAKQIYVINANMLSQNFTVVMPQFYRNLSCKI